MENKINLIRILKNYPKGTPLYCTVYGDCVLEDINYSKDFPIRVHFSSYNAYVLFNKYGEMSDFGECVLFPSSDNHDWHSFGKHFKKGDFVIDVNNFGEHFIMILGDTNWNDPNSDVSIIAYTDEDHELYLDICDWCSVGNTEEMRLATPEEKQLLLDVLDNHNYSYDEETKEVVPKEIGDELQPFEPVLCRDSDDSDWIPDFFQFYNTNEPVYPYTCMGSIYKQCVSYKGHEDYLRTNSSKTCTIDGLLKKFLKTNK